MTVPCLVVIIIAEGSVVCSCWASAGVTGICSTVAGAQSWPPQHSFGYQSWARTLPATAKIIAASSVFGIFIPPLPAESTKPERRLFASPLRSEIAAVLVSVVDCVLGADAHGEADSARRTIGHSCLGNFPAPLEPRGTSGGVKGWLAKWSVPLRSRLRASACPSSQEPLPKARQCSARLCGEPRVPPTRKP